MSPPSSVTVFDAVGTRPRHRFALIVLCLAQFGVVLAYQGTTVSLPEVERALKLSVSSSQWLVSANALVYGGLLLPAGRAADIFGHRRLFIAGSAIFGIASLAAGLAPSIGWLIAARALQGAGTALFTPAMVALLADIFPAGEERNRALAFWGSAGPIGGVSAILLGGALASALGWRAAFLLGAPLSLAIVVLAKGILPAGRPRTRERLDLASALVATLGIGALVYGLSTVANDGLGSVSVVGSLVVGLGLLAVFVRLERRSSGALLPRSLVSQWEQMQPVSVGFFHGAATNTPIVFYSLFMQHYRDASPWDIGVRFVPCNLAIIVASNAGARLAKQIGFRVVMAAGMGIVVAGLLILTRLSVDSAYSDIFLPGWILLGLGLGAAQVGIVGAVTERAEPADRGVIGGMVNTAAQIGTAVGLAFLVALSGWPGSEVDGYRLAFAGAAALALCGCLTALLQTRRG